MLGKTTPYILNLVNIKDKDFELVGKEALIHSYLNVAQVSTSPSFVITSLAFDDFLTAADLIQPISTALKKVRPFIRETAVEASQTITSAILNAKLPSIIERPIIEAYRNLNVVHEMPFVKIEPSHILHSQFIPSSELNPLDMEKSITGIDSLIYQIKLAWLSLFTADAIELRANNYYSGALSLGVIVKKSVASEISGKSYSVSLENLENGYVDIKAIYGLDNADQSFDINCDTYTVDLDAKKISVKHIVPQSQMYVRRGKLGQKDHENLKVNISEAWQKKQKISDERILQIALITNHLSDVYENPVEIFWAIESGDVYVVEVRLLNLETMKSQQTEHPEVNKQETEKENEEVDEKKKVNIPSLVKEVQSMVSNEEEQSIADIELNPSKETEIRKKKLTLMDIKKRSAQLDQNPSWTKKYNLETLIYLDISKVTSARIAAAVNFNGTYFDSTEMVLNNNFLPEDYIDDTSKLMQLADKYSVDISVASKVLEHKPLIYSFSNINEYEKKLLNVESKYKYSGDERFIDCPESLIAECVAVKKAIKSFGAKNINLALPAVRSSKNFESLKKILSTQSMNRGLDVNLYVEVSIPSFIFDINNLHKSDLDGLIIDVNSLLKITLQRNEILDDDYKLIIPQIEYINKVAKEKSFDIIIKIGNLPNFVLKELLALKPKALIFESVPAEETIKFISDLESGK